MLCSAGVSARLDALQCSDAGSAWLRLAHPSSTFTLLNLLINTWDRSRAASLHILRQCPAPLAGLTSAASIAQLVWWTLQLVRSPRLRECDAGALILRTVFHRYVHSLKWYITFDGVDDGVSVACSHRGPAGALIVCRRHRRSCNALQRRADDDAVLAQTCRPSFTSCGSWRA
jgi:hypothetical protein